MRPLLGDLKNFLRTHDLQAKRQLEIIAPLVQRSPLGEPFAQVERSVQKLDYAGALRAFDGLEKRLAELA